MTRLQLKKILLIDSDVSFINEFSVFLSMEGAKCTVVHLFEEAKKMLGRSKFDLVICPGKLADGSLQELRDWCTSKRILTPIVLHECDPFNNGSDLSALVIGALDKNQPEESVDLISSMIGEAVKVGAAAESDYELTFIFEVQKKEFQMNGIEVSDDYLFFTTAKCFDQKTQGVLRVRFQIGTVIETYIVSGYFEQSQLEGQNFKIKKGYMGSWGVIRSRIQKWQDDINEYLNKACGS